MTIPSLDCSSVCILSMGRLLFYIYLCPMEPLTVQLRTFLLACFFSLHYSQLMICHRLKTIERLKFKYVSDRDDNIFEILAVASRTTRSLYLVIACKMHARWIAPKMESSTDNLSTRIYPLFVVILSMLPLSGVVVSIFHIAAGTNIQFSKKSTFTELQVYFGLHPEGRSGLQSRSYPLEGTGFINCVQRCDTQ